MSYFGLFVDKTTSIFMYTAVDNSRSICYPLYD